VAHGLNYFLEKVMIMQMEKQREGSVAKAIEKQTSKLPSHLFLWCALGSTGV
jgi:hypothetical protein